MYKLGRGDPVAELRLPFCVLNFPPAHVYSSDVARIVPTGILFLKSPLLYKNNMGFVNISI